MAIPRENYVLRLHENDGTLVHMNVLDLVHVSATERAALVEWGYGLRGRVDTAGFTIIRFNPLGGGLAQFSKMLCSFSGRECGEFELETGQLVPLADGFILAGTAKNVMNGEPHPIAMRMDMTGLVRWAFKYVADVGHPATARVTSVVPLDVPDRLLVSAFSSDDETWLFQIDGKTGRLVSSRLVSYMHVRRLRRTTLGVLAVGEMMAGPEPAILALDAMDAVPQWLRTATWENQGGDIGVRWFDIAEGKDLLLVVGNIVDHLGNDRAPWMAFLDKNSIPRTADIVRVMVPKLGGDLIRLRRVTNHQDMVIPLTGGDINSIFCVTGDVKNQPWSFAIAEDQRVLWQKQLRAPSGSTGREVPLIWPSYEEIITGGFVATGSVSRGFIASSAVTVERGVANCSDETKVTFPDDKLYQHASQPGDEPLKMRAVDWGWDDGRELKVNVGCLNLQ